MEMIIVKVVKDFSEAKDKNGVRIFGFDPSVGSVLRLRKEDYDAVKKFDLVEEVKAPKPEPRRRRRKTTEEGSD